MPRLRTLHVKQVGDQIRLNVYQTGVQEKSVLSAALGHGSLEGKEPTIKEEGDAIKIIWKDLGDMTIRYTNIGDHCHRYDIECYLKGKGKGEIEDIYDMLGAHWYGAAQIKKQTWPIEKWQRKPMAFVCGDSYVDEYGGVQERYWLSSLGVALFVDEHVPLFVSMNNNNDMKLKLVSKYDTPYKNLTNTNLGMKYTIFQASDVKAVHKLVTSSVIPRPIGIPDETMFRLPIWSTWAKYKTKIDTKTIMKFAKEIQDNKFKAAQLEIDDDWTPAYGDMEFDEKKFPKPAEMVHDLAKMGYRVTMWVHPFCSPMSKVFYRKDTWVSSTPFGGMTTWWNGVGKCLDVTNPSARQFFSDTLLKLKKDVGFLSYKFDAGEVNWLPKWYTTNEEMANPNTYTKLYAELCHKIDPDIRAQEVRVGWRTQHLPTWVRMMDKDSHWSYDNGLKSLIPHALTFSVLGYHFCLPDMIGGNAYKTEFPERELFVRWLQANVFLPSLQFSIGPWQYDAEVILISRKMTQIHEEYADYMIELAQEAVQTGAPIIRPLWWLDPNDKVAQTIDSEFMLGDKILVAPVLDKDATTRDIYLPAGRWRDEFSGNEVGGGVWLYGHPAPLHILPYFTNLTPPAPSNTGNADEYEDF